jgi:NitT/TauT family transport system ATP-binding protein
MLIVDNVVKSFGNNDDDTSTRALDGVSLTVETGEFLTIIGPSGCGKSTLLSSIAGFLQPDSGEITVDGSRVNGPAAGRAVVFQQASLMPWRTVAKNVAYGLTLQKVLSRKDIPGRVQAAIATVGLQGYENHYPHQISGGMQQRVNLARALATQPELLLMDEPFGALDALTKEVLQDELLEIVQKRTSTTIFITHDIEEAVFLGDRVVVMSARPGRIAHVQELPFDRPRDRTLMKSPEFTGIVSELREMLRHEPTSAGSREGVAAL